MGLDSYQKYYDSNMLDQTKIDEEKEKQKKERQKYIEEDKRIKEEKKLKESLKRPSVFFISRCNIIRTIGVMKNQN